MTPAEDDTLRETMNRVRHEVAPHQTSMPASWMRRTFSASVPPARTFWNFLASRSDSSSGLSMPTKHEMKLARTISSISSASSARRWMSSDLFIGDVRVAGERGRAGARGARGAGGRARDSC